jgi:hypothetical protein
MMPIINPRTTDAPKGGLPFWLTLGGLLLAASVLVYNLTEPTGLSPRAVYALLSLTSLGLGGATGFLFGIPHTKNGDTAANQLDGQGHAVPSTSLEQVSDWLTKIIIGVGLVELSKLRVHLSALGVAVNRAVDNDLTRSIVPQLLVVVFAVLGFLAVYIWTRIYYGGIQSQADAEMRRLGIEAVRKEADEAKQQAHEATLAAQQANQQAAANTEQIAANRTAIASASATPLPKSLFAGPIGAQQALLPDDSPKAVLQRKLAAFMEAAPAWDKDTGRDLFGSPPADDPDRHRHLRVVVSWRSDSGQRLYLKAEVTGEAGAPLLGKVVFLLHPTYLADRAKTVVAPPENGPDQAGHATFSFVADGSFTLIALTDLDSDTPVQLSYDLATLGPGPGW